MMERELRADEYINADDGLVWCRKCKKPRQIRVSFGIYNLLPRVACACQQEELDRENEARRNEQFRRRIEDLREKGLGWKALRDYRFENDSYKDQDVMAYMEQLVEKFHDLPDSGYLLWGPHGTGKTYAAACAVNALIDQGISASMRSFSAMADELTALTPEGQQEYLDRFFSSRLLCIDDVHFKGDLSLTARMKGMILDRWIRTSRPSIITTAYTMTELKNPTNETEEMYFGELLGKCVPITCSGPDIRRLESAKRYKEMKAILKKD